MLCYVMLCSHSNSNNWCKQWTVYFKNHFNIKGEYKYVTPVIFVDISTMCANFSHKILQGG